MPDDVAAVAGSRESIVVIARTDERRQAIAADGLGAVAVGVGDPKGAAASANSRTGRFEMPLVGRGCRLTTAGEAADLAVPGWAWIVERGTAHADLGAEPAVGTFGETPAAAPHDEALTVIETRSSSH